MREFDLQSVIENLSSNEIEPQIVAVEKAAEISNFLTAKAIEALKKGPHRYFVSERLYRFGSAVVKPLEELLKESDDSETKILASLVLLRFGSKVGVPWLLDAVAKDEQYPSLVATCLAAAGITEAIEPIVARLRRSEFREVDLLIGFLCALEDFGSDLPADLRDRFSVPDAPWQIRTMLKDAKLSSPV